MFKFAVSTVDLMKILHVINDLTLGGAQRLLSDLARLLATDREVEIGIATLYDSGDSPLLKGIQENPAITLHELRSTSRFNYKTLSSLRRISKGYDIIHAHLFPSGYLTALANPGKKLVYTEHSTHNRRRDKRFLRPVERFIYSRYSAVTAISDPVKEALNRWIDSEKTSRKTTTIFNGVDLRRFEKIEKKSPRDLFGRDGKPLLMISRFTTSKDHESLIKALSLVDDREMFLAFAGEGDTMERMKNLASECGVADRCLFLGNRDDIPDLVGASYIGIQASHWEGFGLTAVEMMAGGLPVVASDVPGLRDVVESAGLLYKAGDPESLAKAINVLAADTDLYQQTRQNCLERAKKYDIGTTARQYLTLYRSLLD